MNCTFCAGTGSLWKMNDEQTAAYAVTCPCCVRGVTVLGTHEMLRNRQGQIFMPGTVVR